MKGRKPLPNEVHELEKGKLYGDVAARVEMTPKARKNRRPRCPQRLTKAQRKVWHYYADILKDYGMFTLANGPILEFLAINTVFFYECYDDVRENGILIKTDNGNWIYNQAFNAMNKIEGKILKYLSELGLSSTGLARIGSLMTGAAKKKSEMEELID